MTAHSTTTTGRNDRIKRRIWVGLLAVIVYILLAAVLGNLIDLLLPTADTTTEFLLTHYIPLPIAIIAGLLFARSSGWSGDIWHEESTLLMKPKRAWLVAIPGLLVVIPLSQVFDVPWTERGLGTVAIILIGTAMVGFGEELYFRGILLTSIRAHHGELVTLITTSLLFAAAHLVGSIWAGVPLDAITFQIAVLAMNGSLYYWVRRVSGRLWVAMAIHALTDCILYLASGAASSAEAMSSAGATGNPVLVTAQFALIIGAALGVISAIREDSRTRRTNNAILTT